ncbi:MAG: threonine/serine dehydratase [Candidatus Hodarchaeales archaeon]|jgi:threonine dehydratase
MKNELKSDTLYHTVQKAEKRIQQYKRVTPLEFSSHLSRISKSDVFLKLENQQITGSFKIRGALNKILTLSETKKFVTASSGNHGLAVAHALQLLGGSGTIYLPTSTAQVKINALRQYDIELQFVGDECQESEVFARKVASKELEVSYISPYNDLDVIGGQGTIGIELAKQLTQIDTVLVSVGGGGLISGIAGYLTKIKSDIEIIGCIPENSPVMHESIKAGKIVDMIIKPTLSDGTAGGIEANSITFQLCQQYVDRFIVIQEKEIANAIHLILEKHHLVIEGAAGVTVAAYLKEKHEFEGKNVVLIICGGNIGLEDLKNIICD